MDRALAAFLSLSNPTNLNCLVKAKRCAAFMGMPKNTRFFQLAQRLKKLGLSFNSVASAVKKLLEAKILREMTSKSRNRIYEYTEYVNILKSGTEL